jgi:hypothetical protein
MSQDNLHKVSLTRLFDDMDEHARERTVPVCR